MQICNLESHTFLIMNPNAFANYKTDDFFDEMFGDSKNSQSLEFYKQFMTG